MNETLAPPTDRPAPPAAAPYRTPPTFDYRRASIDDLLAERRRLERIPADRTDHALGDAIADDLTKIELMLQLHRDRA